MYDIRAKMNCPRVKTNRVLVKAIDFPREREVYNGLSRERALQCRYIRERRPLFSYFYQGAQM